MHLPLHLTLFSPTPSHPAKPQGWGGGRFRGGVKQFRRNIIADNASSMPWKRDLLGTFLSFCPMVTQNPTLVHSVSVPPCLPCAARLTLSPASDGLSASGTACFWARFARQTSLLNAPKPQSFIFHSIWHFSQQHSVTQPNNRAGGVGGLEGGSNSSFVILLLIMPQCSLIYALEKGFTWHISKFLPHCDTKSNPSPQCVWV